MAIVFAKCLSIQKFNLGKVCLKAVERVALSLQRLHCSFCSASDFQSYDDSAELIVTEEEATQYAEQIAVKEEEEDMLLSRFADKTDLPDWYFIFS